MASGFGGGYSYDVARISDHPSDEIKTWVTLTLPFGLPGLNGDYQVRTPTGIWRVWSNTRYTPPQALEAFLEGYRFELDADGWVSRVIVNNGSHEAPKRKMVSLDPDRWGRSWRSEVYLVLDGLLLPSDTELLPVPRPILEPCCVVINKLLDAITYVGGPAYLPPITPEDFWSIKVEYVRDNSIIGSIQATGLHTFWWRGPRSFDADTQDALRNLLASEAFLPLQDDLIVSSTRKLVQGDYRGSIIDSICAVESVIAPFLERRLVALGISHGKIKGLLGPSGLGLSDQIHVLLPVLHPENPMPVSLKTDFTDANGKRNRIVHRGEGANRREAERHLITCRKVITHLAAGESTRQEVE